MSARKKSMESASSQKELTLLFREAFERHSDELFRHAALRLPDRERAFDITQEAFLRAWQYVQRGERVREMRAFLFRTLRNLIIDEYRKAKSHSLDALIEDEEGNPAESRLLADETDALEAAMGRFDGAHAVSRIEDLPDLYREVLMLRYVSDLAIAEIAEYIGESENVVSVRLHRGIKKLRTLLEEE